MSKMMINGQEVTEPVKFVVEVEISPSGTSINGVIHKGRFSHASARNLDGVLEMLQDMTNIVKDMNNELKKHPEAGVIRVMQSKMDAKTGHIVSTKEVGTASLDDEEAVKALATMPDLEFTDEEDEDDETDPAPWAYDKTKGVKVS